MLAAVPPIRRGRLRHLRRAEGGHLWHGGLERAETRKRGQREAIHEGLAAALAARGDELRRGAKQVWVRGREGGDEREC